MKLIFSILFALVFALPASAQITNTTPITDTTQITEPLPKFMFTADEAKTLLDLFTANMVSQVCSFQPSNPQCEGNEQKISDAYAKSSKSPNLLNYLSSKAINDFERIRRQTKFAQQVSQVSDEHNVVMMRIVVAQNQRIIELLEALVKKK